MNPETDLQADYKSCKSEETYLYCVADYDSVEHEHLDGVNEVKMEKPTMGEVKSEKPVPEPTVINMEIENMVLNDEFCIKSEYDEDAIADLKWDRIKVEQKFDPGIEAVLIADTADQIKMEFQESEKVEEKLLRSVNSENVDALGLNEEIHIKTEFDQNYVLDSACGSAQIKKMREKEKENPQIKEGKQSFSCHICNYTSRCRAGLIVHIERNNCHLGSKLGKLRSASRERYQLNKYCCIKCNMSFKSKRSLDDHEVRKHVESDSSKNHECKFCDFKTVFKNTLTKHIMSRHTDAKVSGLHKCKHCNTSFKQKPALFDHILKNHPHFSGTVSSKIYECMHCALRKTTRNNFIRHMTKHNTRMHFDCIRCDASFKTKLRLDHHTLQSHPEFTASVSHKIHECVYCEYKTTHEQYLVRHMKKHSGPKFACTKCDASFTGKQSLSHHILQKHPESTASVSSKIHECTHCGYKTTRATDLVAHSVKHTGVKLTCTKCDATFTRKHSLDNHILQKHPECTASVSSKIHECTHCEYKTTRPRDLAGHTMKHTGTKFACTNCDASFAFKQSLDNHTIQRHPEFTDSVSRTRYECTYCEYKTTLKYRINDHVRKHTQS